MAHPDPLTPLLQGTLQFTTHLRVTCPRCEAVLYDGPPLETDLTEPMPLGSTQVCEYCNAEILMTHEVYDFKFPANG